MQPSGSAALLLGYHIISQCCGCIAAAWAAWHWLLLCCCYHAARQSILYPGTCSTGSSEGHTRNRRLRAIKPPLADSASDSVVTLPLDTSCMCRYGGNVTVSEYAKSFHKEAPIDPAEAKAMAHGKNVPLQAGCPVCEEFRRKQRERTARNRAKKEQAP